MVDLKHNDCSIRVFNDLADRSCRATFVRHFWLVVLVVYSTTPETSDNVSVVEASTKRSEQVKSLDHLYLGITG